LEELVLLVPAHDVASPLHDQFRRGDEHVPQMELLLRLDAREGLFGLLGYPSGGGDFRALLELPGADRLAGNYHIVKLADPGAAVGSRPKRQAIGAVMDAFVQDWRIARPQSGFGQRAHFFTSTKRTISSPLDSSGWSCLPYFMHSSASLRVLKASTR